MELLLPGEGSDTGASIAAHTADTVPPSQATVPSTVLPLDPEETQLSLNINHHSV